MRSLSFGLVFILLAACTREGEPFLCSDANADYDMVSQVDRFTGEIVGYEGQDANGIALEIDEDNSRSFDCASKAEIQAGILKREQERRAACQKATGSGNPWVATACSPMAP